MRGSHPHDALSHALRRFPKAWDGRPVTNTTMPRLLKESADLDECSFIPRPNTSARTHLGPLLVDGSPDSFASTIAHRLAILRPRSFRQAQYAPQINARTPSDVANRPSLSMAGGGWRLAPIHEQKRLFRHRAVFSASTACLPESAIVAMSRIANPEPLANALPSGTHSESASHQRPEKEPALASKSLSICFLSVF